MDSQVLGQVLVAALVLWVIVKMGAAFRRGLKGDSDREKHCMTCGSDGEASSFTRGSMAIEIVLWICFIIPGLIYSLWRLSTRHAVCSTCGSTQLVPANTPAARAHKASLGPAAATE